MQPPEDEDDSWVKKHPIFFCIVWSHGMRILILIVPLRPDLTNRICIGWGRSQNSASYNWAITAAVADVSIFTESIETRKKQNWGANLLRLSHWQILHKPFTIAHYHNAFKMRNTDQKSHLQLLNGTYKDINECRDLIVQCSHKTFN